MDGPELTGFLVLKVVDAVAAVVPRLELASASASACGKFAESPLRSIQTLVLRLC